MDGPLIVNVNSAKGGAGKTTLALAIALSGLRRYGREELPVVLIDADVFGTEVADLLLPGRSGRWSLALLDVLVQSTGGNLTVAGLVRARLRQALEDRTSLPFAQAQGLPPLLVIPSLAARDPVERHELLGPGHGSPSRLDTGLVAESLGRLQLELRLTALVDAVLEVVQPRLLILDHAPFHFPLSVVPRCWSDENELIRLLHDPDAPRHWQGRSIRHLEVAAADQQDLLRFLAVLGDSDRRKMARENGTRWVLNRDLHRQDDDTLDSCNCHRLLPLLVQGWPELAHVPMQPQLLGGIHGRNLAGLTFDRDGGGLKTELLDRPLTAFELLAEATDRNQLDPLVFNPDRGRFEQGDWLELLR